MRPACTSLSFTGWELSPNKIAAEMKSSVDVAIIGAGQAGLAVSWHLTQAGVDHLVLESGHVAQTWRTRRWDSFCLVTPNWTIKLPGAEYDGPNPDGYLRLTEILSYFESWASSFRAPVREHSEVLSLEADDGLGFRLTLADAKLHARTVVVASGAYQGAFLPVGSQGFGPGVAQILAEDYRHPGALAPGAVLIVGSGQTGCQLAEELHEAGRKVFIACGRCPWGPRRIDGRDIVWWAAMSGFLDRTRDELPSPAARLVGNIVTTGHGGGHDLHLRTLHAMGIELLGHFAEVDGDKIRFADDLAASADFGDARLADLWKYIDAYCARAGMASPSHDTPAPLRLETRTELDVKKDGIGAIIWTSGYRPDYRWVQYPVFDQMGFPIQTDGATAVPGLYFAGVHYLRKLKSSILYGVGEDAEMVAQHIVKHRR
jgi:putative flavoprotein involved in K+ transport